jgi:hypothetical protein
LKLAALCTRLGGFPLTVTNLNHILERNQSQDLQERRLRGELQRKAQGRTAGSGDILYLEEEVEVLTKRYRQT